MSQIGETMVIEMQGRNRGGGERTLLEFLRERMDGVSHVERRRKSLKERLGFTGFSCCGAHWGFGFGPIVLDNHEESPHQQQPLITTLAPVETSTDNSCDGDSLGTINGEVAEVAGMNLAAALAAERQFRAAQDSDGELSPSLVGVELNGPNTGPAQNRISLMRLIHETECEELEREDREKVSGCEMACCVCMGRKKGAAFIPCGHTFCRLCSRELWLNRGSCPLCNRPILEILDIF